MSDWIAVVVRFHPGELARIDEARGSALRTRWIRGAIKKRLEPDWEPPEPEAKRPYAGSFTRVMAAKDT